jgi:dephospho-CoA kinase
MASDHTPPGSIVQPLVIGLTGGIGSGKSAAAAVFSRLGVPVIDADVIARELVAKGEPALAEIATAFGEDILDAGGGLDRAALRQRVFADPAERQRLEAILHPRIRRQIQRRISHLEAPYCVVVIPLLLETGQTDLVDRVLVIDLPEDAQIHRVAARDRLGREEILAILKAQTSRKTRLAAADDIIDNSGGPEELEVRVLRLHDRYRDMAAARQNA